MRSRSHAVPLPEPCEVACGNLNPVKDAAARTAAADQASLGIVGIQARDGRWKDTCSGNELKLWAAVIKKAINDTGNTHYSAEALRWILEEEERQIGGFAWIIATCLGVEVEKLRAVVMARVEAISPNLKIPRALRHESGSLHSGVNPQAEA